MLNGVAPILIVTFYNKDLSTFVSGLPLGQELVPLVGFPIPFYLDEPGLSAPFLPSTSGIYIDSESKGIEISTEVEATATKSVGSTEVDAPVVKQTAVDSTITVNMVAKRDSTLLIALLQLSDMILRRVVSQEYGITYLNRSTTIFGGLLQRFNTSPGSNDDLIRIEMVLSNAKLKETKEKAAAANTDIPKVDAPLPPN